jgi:hypothetical protein
MPKPAHSNHGAGQGEGRKERHLKGMVLLIRSRGSFASRVLAKPTQFYLSWCFQPLEKSITKACRWDHGKYSHHPQLGPSACSSVSTGISLLHFLLMLCQPPQLSPTLLPPLTIILCKLPSTQVKRLRLSWVQPRT